MLVLHLAYQKICRTLQFPFLIPQRDTTPTFTDVLLHEAAAGNAITEVAVHQRRRRAVTTNE